VKGRKLRPYIFNAQDQQEPAPRTGGIFQRDKFKYYEPEAIKAFEEETLSLDCTFKDTAGADRVALQAWGRIGPDCYLKEAEAHIAGITRTIEMVRDSAKRNPRASIKLVEDKANGPAVVELLKNELSGMTERTPEGGKIARANACEPILNGGNFYVPNPYDANGNPRADRAWVLAFIEELCTFPKGSYDDQVDAATQNLIYFKGHESAFLRYLEQLAAQKAAAEAAKKAGGQSA
jgi:predicted phage terminase large subunit-like protein